jgi:serine kinase of HPr protein (carbohydrate metabolism regulator)
LTPTILHAGLIALYDRGAWKGVLIEGPSGVGKSDLALRALGQGFRLVADDRVNLWALEGHLFGAAPTSLAGLIEVRGLGVLPHPARPFAEVKLAVQCLAADEDVERVPESRSRTLLEVAVPLIALRPLEASAPDKIRLTLSLLG